MGSRDATSRKQNVLAHRASQGAAVGWPVKDGSKTADAESRIQTWSSLRLAECPRVRACFISACGVFGKKAEQENGAGPSGRDPSHDEPPCPPGGRVSRRNVLRIRRRVWSLPGAGDPSVRGR